jgi:hypothetical protein
MRAAKAETMSDYSKKSWPDLKKCLESPADTPDYLKAKEERDHRMRRYQLFVAAVVAGVTMVGVVIKIFSK